LYVVVFDMLAYLMHCHQAQPLRTALSARLAPSAASATMTSFRDRDATRAGAVASMCYANLLPSTETVTARTTDLHKYLRHLSCNSSHQTNHLTQTYQTTFDIARPKQPEPANLPSEPERTPSPTRSLLSNTDDMISAILLVLITIFRTYLLQHYQTVSPRN
jgi:hypothetical protein